MSTSAENGRVDSPTWGQEESEPRWLSPAETRAWLAFWWAMHLVDATVERDLQGRSGLSHGEYQILATLSIAPGGPAAHGRARRGRRRLAQPADLSGDAPGSGRPGAPRGLPRRQARHGLRVDGAGDGGVARRRRGTWPACAASSSTC